MMAALLHVLHSRMRRPDYWACAAGGLSPGERRRVERLAARCPACRTALQAARLAAQTLAATPAVRLTPAEAARLRAGVFRRIEQPAAAAPAARRHVRELLADHPRMSLVSAMATVALALGFLIGPMLSRDVPRPAGPEVVSVEAGENASVMVFQRPGSAVPVIWVFEQPAS
jgi:anti-sigma factor RsiW